MTLAEFLSTSAKRIIAEWEEFARAHVPAADGLDLGQRRDHIAGILQEIAQDLANAQSKDEQAEKAKGASDADGGSETSASAHGTDRAAHGFSPLQMSSEFRALRASVLRLWSEAQSEFSRAHVEEITRFNEAIDQALAESITTFSKDVERSKELLLGIVGHDLRNPLGAIMMSATAMMIQEGPDWPHLKSTARIINCGTRMDGIICDLLDFTRARLGNGMPVNLVEMDMEAVCRQTVDEITAFHPGFIVRFAASGTLWGQWDRGRIGQALSNLVGNAHQHGLKDVAVEVALRGDAEAVVLTVNNQGPVIAKRDLKDIFNPFRQLDPSRTTSQDPRSVGLGLYIVQAIVTAHHGTIDVESTDDGTTFTVRLPRNDPSAPPLAMRDAGVAAAARAAR